MRPARLSLRVHAAFFLVSAAFSVFLFAFGLIPRGQLLWSTLVLFAASEVSSFVQKAMTSRRYPRMPAST